MVFSFFKFSDIHIIKEGFNVFTKRCECGKIDVYEKADMRFDINIKGGKREYTL